MIAASEEGKHALNSLGIRKVDASSELETFLNDNRTKAMAQIDWNRFWTLAARVAPDRTLELIRQYGFERRVPVITVARKWRALTRSLLPGSVVPGDGSRDSEIAIHPSFVNSHGVVLKELGAVQAPIAEGGRKTEFWFAEYRKYAVTRFLSLAVGAKRKPSEEDLDFDRSSCAGPLDFIFDLSDEGRVRFTELLLLSGVDDGTWVLSHKKNPNAYQTVQMEPPSLWVIRREGRLRTSLGPRPVPQAVGPALRQWASFLPVADCTEDVANRLKLPMGLQFLSKEQWRSAFEVAANHEKDAMQVARFYIAASRYGDAPGKLRCRFGRVTDVRSSSEVFVTADPVQIELLQEMEVPFLGVESPDDAQALIERWHLKPADLTVSINLVTDPTGAEIPLVDRFPGLSPHIPEEASLVTLQPCASVRLEKLTSVGKQSREQTVYKERDIIYFLDRLSNDKLLDESLRLLNVKLGTGRPFCHTGKQG